MNPSPDDPAVGNGTTSTSIVVVVWSENSAEQE